MVSKQQHAYLLIAGIGCAILRFPLLNKIARHATDCTDKKSV
jgi:hypothetical protein